MNTNEAYDIWSNQYDSNRNKTRDLEAESIKKILANIQFENCLEIGCGTGKNTLWLTTKAKQITAVDLSAKMLAKAKEKITFNAVEFVHEDITKKWTFANRIYDLVTFSLVLEHIKNLDHIFSEASESLAKEGYLYVGELHPFKQYQGSKASFETETGIQVIECFTHNISDFAQSAKSNNLNLIDINEYFDDDDQTGIPRILTLLFKKN